HTPYGDKYVTVILDLTPIRDRSGHSRLLDMVPGRSKRVFKTWLASQPDTWRSHIEIVAMDGFTGFKSAAAEELPNARAVMDPFHVVHLAGDALDECRRRIQQELHHRRGRATDPLYKARRMLHTRSCLLTPRQQHRILDLFASDCHVALEVTWSVYQNIIDAYRDPNKIRGKALMQAEINTLTSTRVPRGLTELITLGRTLKRRAGDILAYFDHPHT
ncbi:ISL3 family transposase, partial [Pauljensenia sp. UMB3104]|uniref:ISL3 family transposase n=1 Tax=Pauljensenia sp. UMB3104 TaxID=3046331 RepID=UPI00254AE50E